MRLSPHLLPCSSARLHPLHIAWQKAHAFYHVSLGAGLRFPSRSSPCDMIECTRVLPCVSVPIPLHLAPPRSLSCSMVERARVLPCFPEPFHVHIHIYIYIYIYTYIYMYIYIHIYIYMRCRACWTSVTRFNSVRLAAFRRASAEALRDRALVCTHRALRHQVHPRWLVGASPVELN